MYKNKAVFVFHDTDYFSGGTRSLLDLLDSFIQDNRFECIAIVPDKTGTAVSYLRKQCISIIYSRYYQINYLTDEGVLKYLFRLPKRLKRLVITLINGRKLSRKLEAYNIDSVYSNTGFIITGLLIKKYIPNVTHLWHLREFGEEDHHYGILFGRKIYYYLLNKYTDEVILISKALNKKFEQHIVVPNISIIYDDVSGNYIQPAGKKYVEGETMNILMAGLICEGKGQIQALKAVKILKSKSVPVKLFLAGSFVNNQYKNLLEKFVSDNNLESEVQFMGMVEDINGLRRKMKFGIIASSSEAFGRVTIEGMLSEMCMIGANVGGTKELIENESTGLLYENGNYIQLAEIVHKLYCSPSLVNEIRQQGFLTALRFTEGKCSESVKEILMKSQNTYKGVNT